MTLVDSSVWIEHLRGRTSGLGALLGRGDVGCHPFVIGELALGSLRNRSEILELLSELPSAHQLRHEEAIAFVEQRRLAGRGLGWIDVHLVASALLEGWSLWTIDRRFAEVARELGVGVTAR